MFDLEKTERMLILSLLVLLLAGLSVKIYSGRASMNDVKIRSFSPEDARTCAVKVNINKADESELAGIRGIGTLRARAIIEYRARNGSFATAEDIRNVKGIKQATFDRIKDKITVE
jgi:comEA protein